MDYFPIESFSVLFLKVCCICCSDTIGFPSKRSLLSINYLVRLDRSTPRQFLLMYFLQMMSQQKSKIPRETEKKKIRVTVLPFLAAPSTPGSHKPTCVPASSLWPLRHGTGPRLLFCSGALLIFSSTPILHRRRCAELPGWVSVHGSPRTQPPCTRAGRGSSARSPNARSSQQTPTSPCTKILQRASEFQNMETENYEKEIQGHIRHQ